ncbi:MAG: enoyl-CoA hydratase/isomerase family protein [Thermoleophilia bacterium]|nr:enoyl-CoA hydratase/isomerase family protein [Thermoleophilia bacterium]
MSTLEHTDVLYEVKRGVAWITINRPERYNAFRAQTVDQLIACFRRAWADGDAGAIVLTGAGDKAFCTGGDMKEKALTGSYGIPESGIFDIQGLHRLIRDVPKPVIAAVNGFAIGGGHVLHVLCDLSIAAEHARFGQAGPRVGSFDAGFGAAYLARVVGEKRAREIWFLLDQYDADTAERFGLVNRVVPLADLHATAQEWGERIAAYSPTALRFLKTAFNADSEQIAGISRLAYSGLDVFTESDEAHEGTEAFAAKRTPDFSRFRNREFRQG